MRLDTYIITHWWTYPRSPKMNAHVERFNRTLQEQFVDYHTDLLFDDLAAFNRNWLTGCWFTIPCCLTIALGANLRHNSSFTSNQNAKCWLKMH